MPQQAVEAVHAGVGGKAQLGENRDQCRSQHAVEIVTVCNLSTVPEHPCRQCEEADDQPLHLHFEAGQPLPVDKGPRPQLRLKQLQINHQNNQSEG